MRSGRYRGIQLLTHVPTHTSRIFYSTYVTVTANKLANLPKKFINGAFELDLGSGGAGLGGVGAAGRRSTDLIEEKSQP